MADDMVTRVENRVRSVQERATEAANRLFDQVQRPFDSEPVKPDDMTEEYILTVAMHPDPRAAFKRRIEEKIQQDHFSTEQALTWGVDWAEKSERHIAKMNGGKSEAKQPEAHSLSQPEPMGASQPPNPGVY